jgi:protein TonB
MRFFWLLVGLVTLMLQAHVTNAQTLTTTNKTQESDVITENQRRIEELQIEQDQLLAEIREQLAAIPKINPDKSTRSPKALALEDKRQRLTQLLDAIERRIEEEKSRPRKRYLSPATLDAICVPYFNNILRKIEARGTEDFPQIHGRKLYGELMMALLIHHDGRLLEAHVVESSGNPELDQIAESIVMSAAPFEPFSEEMRQDTDQFDITTRFTFFRKASMESSLQSSSFFQMTLDRLR